MEICNLLKIIEQKKGLQENSIKIIPSIETALGLIHSYEICSKFKQRTIAVCFGADDYANDLGFTRNTKDQAIEKELEYARNVIAVSAKASSIPSIDTPNVNFKNPSNLEIESRHVKSMGFKGKFAIHPNQIDTLNHIFGISEHEYLESKKIVDAFELSLKEKRGSTSVDGRMVDIPVYKRASQVLNDYNRLKDKEELKIQ